MQRNCGVVFAYTKTMHFRRLVFNEIPGANVSISIEQVFSKAHFQCFSGCATKDEDALIPFGFLNLFVFFFS
jgi:hypothetical protein